MTGTPAGRRTGGSRHPAHTGGRTKYRFPWRAGNRFELLIDGNRFYPRMLEAIGAARHYLLLEIYLVESGAVMDRFIAALSAAATRGVEVNMLFDDFGARALRAADRRRLTETGARLVFYNPLFPGKLFRNLARNHRKLLLVDGEVAFVGGAGISDVFDPPRHPLSRWRETMLRIEGPVVADWRELFALVWARHGGPALDLSPAPARRAGNARGQVNVNRGVRREEVKRALIRYVHRARRRVWIATAYFVPSRRILRALRQAAGRGADVRLLLPGPHTDHPGVRQAGRRYYAGLLRAGVRIFEYQPRMLHAKVNLCDHWASIGSSNLDRWNLRWNLEANQSVRDAAFADSVRAMFEDDFADCIEWTYEKWRARPWYERASEQFWGWIDQWLNRLGRGRVWE
ncbi:MAG TPA: phospholipase D-like domain-containing protein [Acidiferrobacterales bacterium]